MSCDADPLNLPFATQMNALTRCAAQNIKS